MQGHEMSEPRPTEDADHPDDDALFETVRDEVGTPPAAVVERAITAVRNALQADRDAGSRDGRSD